MIEPFNQAIQVLGRGGGGVITIELMINFYLRKGKIEQSRLSTIVVILKKIL